MTDLNRLLCRVRGHRWQAWHECLRPDLYRRYCARCGADEFEDRCPTGIPLPKSRGVKPRPKWGTRS